LRSAHTVHWRSRIRLRRASYEEPWAPFVGKSTITFVESVGIRVVEEDDTSANNPSRFNLVPALGVNDMVLDGLKNPVGGKFEDGEYRFTFRLRK
jgi:hypothetical protein